MTAEMNIKIELASLIHLDTLCEIEKQSFREEAFARTQIAALLTDCNVIAYIVRAEGEIAGFIIATVDDVGMKLVGHILTLDVLPLYRGRGIAKKLLQAVEATFREKGISECRLEVREDNTAALDLYLKLGYERVGKLKRYYGKRHGLYLRKPLQTSYAKYH